VAWQEERCPECGSEEVIVDHERGEIICQKCGLVISSNIVDEGPEWRAFDHEQLVKRDRVGPPLSPVLYDEGLSTQISIEKIGYEDASKRRQLYRLRKWQRKIKTLDATAKNLALAFFEIRRISSILGLPEHVVELAATYYRQALKKRLIKGRSIEGVCAAVIYLACKEAGIPRKLSELAEAANVNRKEVGRNYRNLVRSLAIKVLPTRPIDFIPRFSAALKLPGIVSSYAIKIALRAREKGLSSGRGAPGLAAAAIYIAATLFGERRTQKEVAQISGVTEVTVRNRYKEMFNKLNIEVLV